MLTPGGGSHGEASGWSLRIAIPSLILICGLAIIALQSVVVHRVASNHVRQEASERLRLAGTWLSRSASRHLARARPDLLAEDVRFVIETLPELEFVAIADRAGTILETNDPTWLGRALAQHPYREAPQSRDERTGSTVGQVREISSGERLWGLFRLETPTSEEHAEGGVARDGSILMILGLQSTLHTMHHRVFSVAVASAVAVGLIAALLWFALDRVLTRPLGRLAGTLRAFDAGDFAIAGGTEERARELGEIGSALTRLGGTLREGARTQAARSRLAQIVEDSTSEIYVADADTFRLLDANRAARENLGYTAGGIDRLGPWDFVDGMSEADVDALVAPLREGRLAEHEFETVHRRRDGSTYPVETRLQFMGSQTPPVYVAIVQDITERKRRDARIRLLERAVEAVDVGVSITDATRAGFPLVYVNETLCRMSGYAADELLGRNVRELQRGDTVQPGHASIDAAQARGEAVQVLLETTRKDGSTYMDELSLSPVHDGAGRLTHYIGINRDVTSRLASEEGRRQAQRIESVGLLAGGVAHDFNNHLSVVLGNLELLAAELDDAGQRELVDDAADAARMGALLTRRLLAFAREGRLEPVVVDVNERVDGAVGLLRSTIGEQIELRSVLAADLWMTCVDAGEIENAVVNLAINARDAMPGGGHIEIRTGNVRVDDEDAESAAGLAPGDYVALSVADTGSGMSEEIRRRAFEPFFTTKAVGKGSGLGLASVYGFAKQSGGHVAIRSELGCGTAVTLYLPRHVEEGAPERTTAPPDGAGSYPRHGRVLLVEDNDMVRKVTLRRLHSAGFEVSEAASGAEALALLERDARFDLVLSDVVMAGGVSGYDVARATRARWPHCSLLLTSGFSDRVGEAEIDIELPPVLRKPCTLAELLAAVDTALASEPVEV